MENCETDPDMKNQIPKTLLAERLDECVDTKPGLNGLNILLFGWTRKDPDMWEAIRHRNWLYDYEVLVFQEYAGCNLLKMES